MQGQSESRWRVITHRRGGREVRLARGGIPEPDAFLGHGMRGPTGTGRGGVSMAGGSILRTNIHEILYISHLFDLFILLSRVIINGQGRRLVELTNGC